MGSIVLHHERRLKTNDLRRNYSTPNLRLLSFEGTGTFAYERAYEGVSVKKGEELGMFVCVRVLREKKKKKRCTKERSIYFWLHCCSYF